MTAMILRSNISTGLVSRGAFRDVLKNEGADMMRKIVLILIMGVALAGATTTSTPFPILIVMGWLILLALFVALRSEQQG